MISLVDKNLTDTEKEMIQTLVNSYSESFPLNLEEMWMALDLVWDNLGCDNILHDWEKIGEFYDHPVWLLNGLFIEQHDESMAKRHAISDWLVNNGFKRIVDFGGGFGTLTRLIAEKDNSISIHIFEPHPSEFGLKRVKEYGNVKMVGKLERNYDCLVCTDVLEHVPEPLKETAKMIKCVQIGGHLLIANCFDPVIKCHLPQTFHLKYTFDLFAKLMGLQVIGNLVGSHATIYKKTENKSINWKKIRVLEQFSKNIFPFIESARHMIRFIRKLFLGK